MSFDVFKKKNPIHSARDYSFRKKPLTENKRHQLIMQIKAKKIPSTRINIKRLQKSFYSYF
ncbi:mCG147254 [Mus musculus]|nr:mCG147254 [Mus musculus]